MGGLTMDQAFVQAPEHRPKPIVTEATGIPLIDLSPLAASGGAVDALAAEVGAASRDWGFFVVVGHGVPAETVARATEAQRAFFALPAERKAAVRRNEAEPLGYYESEHTKNVRDWKEVYDLVPREPPPPAAVADGELVFDNKWPQDLPGFREALEEYAKAMEELAFKLLELIARSLKLRPDRLHGFFKDQTTFIRLNHYPPCPSPDLALGVGRHKDAGALTILYQDDVGGLDVRRRSDGEWVRVRPVPDSFIINVGDLIQVRERGAPGVGELGEGEVLHALLLQPGDLHHGGAGGGAGEQGRSAQVRRLQLGRLLQHQEEQQLQEAQRGEHSDRAFQEEPRPRLTTATARIHAIAMSSSDSEHAMSSLASW
ncbi:gibberellin 20-oxidase4 [Zea mays]|uniref:Gibberellin 20-oxidase4 n=1 Tax=Zea mays TaxID=4577 RepID=A0A1D6GLQ3_MAIZE|nr:gibberellin 20-oxidase4 [Zea mays]